MSNLKYFLPVLFIFCSTFLFSQEGAIQYMDKISQEIRKIQTDMWEYTNAISHGKSAQKVEKKRMELLKTSQQALNRVKNMSAYDGSSVFRDSVVSFLNVNYLILEEDYAKIVDMEEIAEKSYDNMEAYLMAKEEAGKKMGESAEMVQNQQKTFAEANNINLIEQEDDLSEKMRIADEVYRYYNQIYLIFFKSYIQETYLMAAMISQNVSGIEQNRNALASTANEGLEALKGIESFKSDNSIIQACKSVLMFYKDEAENKVEAITNYLLKAENFNTIRESFEQKKEKNRTQEDVDQYNNAVNDMNSSLEGYNSTNENLNKERADKLEEWNKTVAKFTDKYVPKGKAK